MTNATICIEMPEQCVGCGACASVCPQKCIEMKPDEEGFLYPHADLLACIGCGACRQVCPLLQTQTHSETHCQKAYLLQNQNFQILKSSSSGGAFYPIASAVIKKGGVVFGAHFDDQKKVVHGYTENESGLIDFQGSKYVQSEIQNSYIACKKFLSEGRLVLFSGTPCEIAGLKSFLGCENENLLTCDFICTGVPSPLCFLKYRTALEKKYDRPIQKINFRNKKEGWFDFSTEALFSQGVYHCSHFFDPYILAHFQHLTLRPSCYSCPFKRFNSGSDFKIADAWGAEKLFPEIDPYFGISFVCLQTKKSEKLWEQVQPQFFFHEITEKQVFHYNRALINVSSKPNERETFFKEMQNQDAVGFFKLLKKYTHRSINENILIYLRLLKRKILHRRSKSIW